jgi:hypothetical protein
LLGKTKHPRLSIDVFKQYSLLSGIPLDDLLDECLSEYIEVTIETGFEDLAERAATA